jgi:hypothetical protein
MKIAAFWDVALCSVVEVDLDGAGSKVPVKHRSASMGLHGAYSRRPKAVNPFDGNSVNEPFEMQSNLLYFNEGTHFGHLFVEYDI